MKFYNLEYLPPFIRDVSKPSEAIYEVYYEWQLSSPHKLHQRESLSWTLLIQIGSLDLFWQPPTLRITEIHSYPLMLPLSSKIIFWCFCNSHLMEQYSLGPRVSVNSIPFWNCCTVLCSPVLHCTVQYSTVLNSFNSKHWVILWIIRVFCWWLRLPSKYFTDVISVE